MPTGRRSTRCASVRRAEARTRVSSNCSVAEKRKARGGAPVEGGKLPDLRAQLTARLARCYTGAVHDVLREMGHENIVLPAAIKPLVPQMRLAGPAWTVAGRIDRTRSRHETLLAWCTLLSRAPKDHVIVCQP